MFKPDIEKMYTKRDAGGLIKALSYQKDLNTRIRAVTALGELGDQRALEPLIELLKEEPPGFATFSAFSLPPPACPQPLGLGVRAPPLALQSGAGA